ncbi:MAG: L-serine ammonia-lyase [Rhodobiaceae bacterium]|nr:L-serine ammonia-lyase [Rhodobiaceae bacterium]MCC0051198.1 L-serine ammonia-lyase [Rhodobiaceae bacterium]MCC0059953.1 L-serine ammonia-lyase [Rhodobiaceae bacterium]
MVTSLFDLFKIGVGPSSSHTVGPMKAASLFVLDLDSRDLITGTERVQVDLYGSLALTGKGHATDIATLVGLTGHAPDKVDADAIPVIVNDIRETTSLNLGGVKVISFNEDTDLVFNYSGRLTQHSNGMKCSAFDAAGSLLHEQTYFSVGGGFVATLEEIEAGAPDTANVALPHPFRSATRLLEIGDETGLSIAGIMLANERAWRSDEEIRDGIREIFGVMEACVDRGCRTDGTLPGGLKVRRRAHAMFHELRDRPERGLSDGLSILDWVSLYALAVNEENAAGGRVVTAPTNGAAGIIPAVLRYYHRFVRGANDEGVVTFMLTAAAIGSLYKMNASISAAEVGCQGEVGVACSMAAAGLCAVMGGSNAQIENAAEIGMEHNLGLTCDPIGGLVQVPCIERNTMGAVKAINAARLALRGDGKHVVSLDKVIETMRQTGKDMQDKYKETAQGGLAVNVVEC